MPKLDDSDKIRAIIDAELWGLVEPVLYIGLYNTGNDPINVSLRLREVQTNQTYDTEMLLKNELYEKIYENTDASFASSVERQKISDLKPELTYGEVLFHSFVPVIQFTNPQPGEEFWDLGCGGGKPLVIASLNFPFLKACRGVELLTKLVEIAKNTAEKTR